jgi:tetratricopeptide (TPR) repeat protein/TolB-like protein
MFCQVHPLYNQAVQKPLYSRLLIACSLLLPVSAPLLAQGGAGASDKDPGGRVVLVLPFENRSGQPNLNWIGDSFPDTLNQRLGSAGFLTISRDDREFALDHLGLPADFRPTRATTIRIAQNLDADFVIVGSFNISNPTGQAPRILVQAQVLEIKQMRLSPPLEDSSELPRLFDIENAIAWKVARQIEPHFSVAEQTFLSASAGVRLSAFENYIRGTDATTAQERVKRLEVAVADAPGYAAAQLALGKQQYADRDYDKAAATLARVPQTDRLSLEAGFYLGLSRFNTAKYAEAETAFAFVASRLPLPEVVNDQGVAQSRQNKDALPLFLRASNADPNDPDYHFNVAVTYYKRGDFANAGREIDLSLKLRPADTEATQLRTLINAGRSVAAQKTGFEATTRLRRTYSEASFRQAAFQLDQVRAIRLATLPPAQQATEYTQLGQDYLAQGLLPEAEQEFQSALAAFPSSAPAHAGLAEVREQSGSDSDARAEAQNSLRLSPNPAAYVVLAKLDLKANNLNAAAADVQGALRLDPKYGPALGLQQALQAKGQSLP